LQGTTFYAENGVLTLPEAAANELRDLIAGKYGPRPDMVQSFNEINEAAAAEIVRNFLQQQGKQAHQGAMTSMATPEHAAKAITHENATIKNTVEHSGPNAQSPSATQDQSAAAHSSAVNPGSISQEERHGAGGDGGSRTNSEDNLKAEQRAGDVNPGQQGDAPPPVVQPASIGPISDVLNAEAARNGAGNEVNKVAEQVHKPNPLAALQKK
jgi:hypothetical protein